MSNDFGMTLAEIFHDKYVIPLYQRNFAWRIEEIHQLLQDVHEARRNNPEGNYYIGSLVVLKRHNGDYEVIDGQQRLTVISMIAILLGQLSRPVLFYDSRPEVQEFFEMLCKQSDNPKEALHLPAPSLFYLKEACEFLRNAKAELPDGVSAPSKYLDDKGFAEYFMNRVILVRNEIPEDTDVAAYFEIMNNRGEQLQKHEIVKAQMMDNIVCLCADGTEGHDTTRQSQFSRIWNACARMDIPIHRLISSREREYYFGKEYDSFLHDSFSAPSNAVGTGGWGKDYSLQDILEKNVEETSDQEENAEEETETDIYTYGTIIDFPNFLMHVLRLYCKVHCLEADALLNEKVPLNEKYLLEVYSTYKQRIDSMEFAELLLFCRVVFDRFIVKTAEDTTDQEDGRKWVLLNPKKYKNNWKFISTFEDEKGKFVIKALSMLQVTFRTRIYKTWLFDILAWFYDECWQEGKFSDITADTYLNSLHKWMLDYYKSQGFNIARIPPEEPPSPTNSFSRGTETPHFLLNFIDYLYCCQNPEMFLNTFEFKYWNSVEHHLARNKTTDTCPYIDNLGNLCLVSKSINSRLSDRIVKEKVLDYGKGNLGPNRQIMYKMTQDANYEWKESQIRDHYNQIVELLETRESLLAGITSNP